MALCIRRVDYYYVVVHDRPGEAYELLSQLAAGDVNLLAFHALPMGPDRAQLTLFPERLEPLAVVAERLGLVLDGPHPAILVQGDDRLGALAEVHARLGQARINVYASNGVTDGQGSFGYVVYVQPRDIQAAVRALGA
jgi:hypothetical protein